MESGQQVITFKGYWWLPGRPDDKVAGVLTYTRGKGAVLELVGCFTYGDGNPLMNMFDHKGEPLIYGIESGAKEISLVGCSKGTSYNFSSPFPLTRYSADLVVYDKHIAGLDEVCDYTAYIRYEELPHWCFPGVIKTEYSFENDDVSSVLIRMDRMAEGADVIAGSTLSDGTVVSLKRDGKYSMGESRLLPIMQQDTVLSIYNPAGLSIRQILGLNRKFEQFLSFATLRNVNTESIFLNDPDVSQDLDGGRKYMFPIYLYDRRRIADNPGTIKSGNFLFEFDDIETDFPQIVRRWMDADDDLEPILQHLVDSLTFKQTFGSVDFLVVVQAVEGFWWRFRDEDYKQKLLTSSRKQTTLRTILCELMEEFSDVPAIRKVKDELDIPSIVDSRHYYSHFMRRSSKPNVKDGVELYRLTDSLKKLLICCVGSVIGLGRTSLNLILTRGQ